MDRVAALDAQLEAIILRRLQRQFPAEERSALTAQAALITQLVAGLMRFIGQAWAKEASTGAMPTIDPGSIEVLLEAALTKLR